MTRPRTLGKNELLPPIVFVYFGPEIPKYVYRNVKNTRKLFPNQEIFFITDNQRAQKEFQNFGIEIVSAPDDTFYRYGLEHKLQHDWEFRIGFWKKTLSRVLSVCEFQMEQDRAIVHVEADVILSSNFPFERFAAASSALAYSMVDSERGVASILYLRNQEAGKSLLNFIIDEASRNPLTTDMSVLGQYRSKFSSNVFMLPNIPNIVGASHSDTESNTVHMGGYFDPAQIGQFFFGIDERNTRGWRRLFDQGLFKQDFAQNFKLRVNRGRFFVDAGNCEYELFTLHIHSKDSRAFNRRALFLLAKWKLLQQELGVTIVPTKYLLERQLNFIKHQIKRNFKVN